MATISFKSKTETIYSKGEPLYTYIKVPQFDRKHCDMHAFRTHAKYGPYANSDLFKSMLSGIRKTVFKDGILRLDAIPEGVSVDATGFLAKVTFSV